MGNYNMGNIKMEKPFSEFDAFIEEELKTKAQHHHQLVLIDYTGQVRVNEKALQPFLPESIQLTSIRSTASRPKELDYQYITPTAFAGQWHIENDFIKSCCRSIVSNLQAFLKEKSETKNFFVIFIEKEAKQGRQDSISNPYFDLDSDERIKLRALLQDSDTAFFVLDNS